MIQVTQPFLPPFEEYKSLLKGIWERKWLTNIGPLTKSLEEAIKSELGTDETVLVGNGTLALQLAIRSLDLNGEIITTPFSYIATVSSIVWENCKPVFVDIDKKTLNLDSTQIEAQITKNTSAILATHVYGNPCDIDHIQAIAEKHGLKVIYDGSHCFGTTYKGESVLNFGDISTISFHATKLYQTIEGGAIFLKDPLLSYKIRKMHNFGHDGFDKFVGLGINAKMSEFQAAMGLVNLKYVKDILRKRKNDFQIYKDNLKRVEFPIDQADSEPNRSYVAIILQDEVQCIEIQKKLEFHQIGSRRYFYPLLSDLDYVESRPLDVAQAISKRILCLPTYYDIEKDQILRICDIINQIT